MKFTNFGLLIGAARSAVAGLAFVFSFCMAPAALAQEEAPPAEETTAPAEAVETIAVESAPPAPAPAPAAESATELDTIEVTGSRIKRSDFETAQPILVISREDIDRAGLVSIGDILQNLPQAGAALSRAFNNGGNGATEVDLRNLGSNRVLVLVNGRRWVGGVSQFNTSGVDLNTIPISVIDSIEILKDGASAVYGSDAIAGVVNIKTRRDYVGAETRGHVEATDSGDGVSQALSFAGGTVAGKTSVFFDISYVDQGELRSGDRKETSVPTLGTGLTRGSGNSPFGKAIFVTTPNNANAINAAAGTPSGPGATCYDISSDVANGAINDTVENGAGPDPVTGGPTPGTGFNPELALPNPALPAGVILCDWTLNRDDLLNGDHVFTRYDRNLHSYNFAPDNYLITPSTRTSIFGQLSHQITDQVRFSTEVLYNVRKSAQQLAHTPIPIVGDALGSFDSFRPFSSVYIDKTNPFNPTNPTSPYYIAGTVPQDIARSAGDMGLPVIGYGAANIRLNELGTRLFSQNVDTMRIGGGLDGSFGGSGLNSGFATLDKVFAPLLDRFYSWDGGYAFSESKVSDINAGLVNMDRLGRALGPLDQCVATDATTPPPGAAGCVPLDVFGGPGSRSQEMIDYIKYTAIDTSRQTQKLAYGNISTEIGELSRWLAAPLGIALGIEYREEFFNGQPDPLKVAELSSTNTEKPTRGSYTAKEAYMEFSIPVLADVTFDEVPGLANVAWLKGRSLVQDLEVSLAGRHSQYTGFGNNFSGKIGVRYKPYDDLILRSTLSDAFRAPSIGDLFQGQATSFPEVQDICAGRDDEGRDNEAGIENVRTNCSADGVGNDASSGQIATTFGGNPDLEPETARTLSAGFVYSPNFLPDFNFYADWYSVELDQFIGNIGPDLILELCYRSPPGARAYCDLQQRDATGNLTRFFAVNQNFAALNVEGVDMNLDWILPLPKAFDNLGTFQWIMDTAYVTKFEQVIPTGTGVQAVNLAGMEFGGSFGIPRWKINTGLTWRRGDWEAAWNVRYIHHLIEFCDDGFQDPGAADGGSNPTKVNSLSEFGLCSDPNDPRGSVNKLDATFYNDVQGIYNLPNWNTRLTFGVINVLDQDPPPVYSAFADSYDKALYDPFGSRTPYLRYQINF